MYYENFYASTEAWSKMKTDFPNIKVKSFPAPVVKAMKKATDEVFEKYASKNKLFKEIYDNQQAFMKKARAWSKMGEYGYIKTCDKVK
jgi:TRAP-type mannitol/chloroaromatic compound transport system substrate-binding protein